MLASIGVLVAAVLMFIIEVPNLFKKGLKRETLVFSILLLIGTLLSILHLYNIDPPSPHKWIAIIYRPLSDIIYHFLGFGKW